VTEELAVADHDARRVRGRVPDEPLEPQRDVEELADARTVFAMASYRVLPPLEVRARYVLEIVDRNIHSLYLTLREDF